MLGTLVSRLILTAVVRGEREQRGAPTIEDELAEFKLLGLQVVRWFLMADGTTYGINQHKPTLDPQRSGQWRFHEVPELSEAWLEDFTRLLVSCEAQKIQILPSIIDFHFCFPGVVVPSSPHVKCGQGGRDRRSP
jgi:hypothetical protein